MNTMSAYTMTPLVLLLLALRLPTDHASVIVGCPIFRYMVNGGCKVCPDNCRICDSATNCSVCIKGFHGPVCENKCATGCIGTCHKDFGHCTLGCPDGQYPRAIGNGCQLCPLNCLLCESRSKCARCKDGHFGEGCQERCPGHCTLCNKTTGQCLQCNDAYFMLNGQCTGCPQGCRLCGAANPCIQCKESYFKYNDLCRSCPYGCDYCNTTDNCAKCADGFHGPVDGRCIYECPSNDVTYNVPYEDGRCGIWQDTNTNICQLQSESYSCVSSGNCIRNIRCSLLMPGCRTQQDGQTCATIMQYECKHKCRHLLSTYGCETTCTVHASDNPLCMTDLRTFETSAKAECSQEHASGHGHDSTTMKYGLAIAVLASFVSQIVIVTIFMLYRQKAERREDQMREEDRHGSKAPEPCRRLL